MRGVRLTMTTTKRDLKRWAEREIRIRSRAERFSRELLNEYASFASDTKWKKIFGVLSETHRSEARVFVKLIAEEEFQYPMLFAEHCHANFIDGISGAFSFKELEWVRLPSYEPLFFDFQVELENIGGFTKIYGYRKREA